MVMVGSGLTMRLRWWRDLDQWSVPRSPSLFAKGEWGRRTGCESPVVEVVVDSRTPCGMIMSPSAWCMLRRPEERCTPVDVAWNAPPPLWSGW